MTSPGTVVIVGANLAGGRAAEALRAEGFDGRIVLIGEEPYRPYERPPLSKEILRGEQPHEKAFLRPEEYYADNDIELLLGARAVGLDPGARSVALEEGIEVSYDALLLCTGGRVRRLPVPGMDLDGVLTLRTISDARALGERLRPGARVAVVGAGFIGMEVAASARTLGCEVTVLELFSTPLERVLGSQVGEAIGRIHRDRGVTLRFGVRGERFDGDGAVRAVVLEGGEVVEADVVVVGVGIDPADELARDAGIACEDGILVDERCRTSTPDVYAAGDVANHPNPILGRRIRVEHWQNAQNQAVAAARAMLGADEPFAEIPWFWSDQFDHTMQLFGHPEGYDRVVFRGDPDGAFAAYYLRADRIVGAFALDRAKDARAVRPLLSSGAVVDAEALADEDTDLRALAKR